MRFGVARRALIAAACLMAVGCATPGVVDAHPSASPVAEAQIDRPFNVLLIMADDASVRIGSYGHFAITPNIDRLAQQGVQFNNAYTQFPWCGPSRASFLTGRRPDATKVMDLQTNFRSALPDAVTMPQLFRENGYFSGRVGKIFHQGVPTQIGESGMDDPQSWDRAVNPKGRDKDAENGRLKNLTPGIPLGAALAWLDDEGEDKEQTDGMIADEAIRMIREHKDGPFFIAAGFYRPHVPYVAPQAYFDLYDFEKIPTAKDTPEELARLLPPATQWTPLNLGLSLEDQRRAIHAYLASTSYMDAQVGKIVDAVRDMGLMENTIIVFTTDHGYLLGEHGQWQKQLLWQEATQVPLIVYVPGAAANGTLSERVVELVDVYPTLADVAGLSHAPLDGDSMKPLLANANDPAWVDEAYSQIRGARSIRTDRWRYTEYENGKRWIELYDQKNDPRELVNLANDPAYADVVANLKGKLPKEPVEPLAPRLVYTPGEGPKRLPYDED